LVPSLGTRDDPMRYVLVKHKVKDFDIWKKIFDADAGNRQAAGSKGGVLLRAMDDPNMVYILFEMEDVEKAKGFFRSAQLKKTMEKAGVIEEPHIHFLDTGIKFKF
jgi:hypothetical protein